DHQGFRRDGREMSNLSRAGAALAPLLLWGALSSATALEATGARPAIEIAGQVRQPREVTREDLQRLPQTSVPVSFHTDHGTETGTYTGPLLWTVVPSASFADAPRKNAKLEHKILVTGRDGYAVAVSVG